MSSSTNKPLRIGIVAGEASGDILGMGLIQSLKNRFPDAEFIGVAGEQMQAAGCKTLFPLEEISVMGLFEILKHLPKLLSLRRSVIRYFKKNKPDIFIGIDSPDFNFAIEKALHKQGIFTVHYTSPTVWAWRENRLNAIAKSTDLMLTLFPFELPYYQRYHIPAHFVGHPLADRIQAPDNIASLRAELDIPEHAKVVALLPGSRAGEIVRNAPIFLQAAYAYWQENKETIFISSMINQNRYQEFVALHKQYAPNLPLKILQGQSLNVMSAADCLLLASGTVTLEALLLQKPMIVGYKVSALTYWLAKKLIKIKKLALPNLLAGEDIVPEYIQENLTIENINKSIKKQLEDPQAIEEIKSHYQRVQMSLKQNANEQAAQAILQHFASRKNIQKI